MNKQDISDLNNLRKEFRKFVTNDFSHLEVKVAKIEKIVNSRTALYAFITSVVTLITLILK